MTATKQQWAFGDKIIHSAKPEWGTGMVTAAQTTTHEGQPCQSLTIRFDRAGVKTISTAFAKLVMAGEAPVLLAAAAAEAAREPAAPGAGLRAGQSPMPEPVDGLNGNGFEPATTRELTQVMNRLPDAVTDPFSTPLARLKATINLYKFTPTGSSLLDWAAIQSGLADPMSRFNRHELERFFESFVVVRDAHTKKLIQELKKSDPVGLSQAMAAAPAIVQQTIRRLDAMR